MNILEGLLQATTGPKMAPHVGEAFAMWTYYAALVSSRSMCLVLVNHTADRSVREIMEHIINDVEEPQLKQLTEMMKTEGIPFPQGVPDHPQADEKAIPFGAKFTDAEITNLLVAKLEGMLIVCNNALAQCLRDDITMLFYRFQGQLLTQGLTLKKTMHKRGWLLVPPPFEGHTTAHRPTE